MNVNLYRPEQPSEENMSKSMTTCDTQRVKFNEIPSMGIPVGQPLFHYLLKSLTLPPNICHMLFGDKRKIKIVEKHFLKQISSDLKSR